MTDYRAAPEVQRIAERLIDEHHHDLDGIDIRYVFRSKASKSKGKVVLGRARKVSGLNAYLAGMETEVAGMTDPFFVIEIAEDTWRDLSDAQRVALVDHELHHCLVDTDDNGDPILGIQGHDVEEFASVIRRHGLWHPEVASFGRVVIEVGEQLTLEVEEPA